MGAWDVGSFSNDSALDYLGRVSSLEDVMAPIDAVLAHGGDGVDADLASEAIAAADILAAKIGRPAPDMPVDMDDVLQSVKEPNDTVLTRAIHAVSKIEEASELAELWAEDDTPEWSASVKDLASRLDRKTKFAQRRQRKKKGGTACFFCHKLTGENYVTIEFVSDEFPGLSSAIYSHRECLETLFEPPFYDSDGKPLPELSKRVEIFLETNSTGFAILEGPPERG